MKARPSKLDQFAGPLLEMNDAGKTLDQIVEWLKGEGVSVARSTISEFLERLRQQRLQDRLLGQIASGARQVQAVEKEFGENPAPELETLIKLHRVLVLQMSTQGNADPDLLKLADQLLRTAMEFRSGQIKAELAKQKLSLGERRVKLLEEKAKAFDQAQGIFGNKKLSEEEKTTRMRELFGV